jgi:hypothetical protein
MQPPFGTACLSVSLLTHFPRSHTSPPSPSGKAAAPCRSADRLRRIPRLSHFPLVPRLAHALWRLLDAYSGGIVRAALPDRKLLGKVQSTFGEGGGERREGLRVFFSAEIVHLETVPTKECTKPTGSRNPFVSGPVRAGRALASRGGGTSRSNAPLSLPLIPRFAPCTPRPSCPSFLPSPLRCCLSSSFA